MQAIMQQAIKLVDDEYSSRKSYDTESVSSYASSNSPFSNPSVPTQRQRVKPKETTKEIFFCETPTKKSDDGSDEETDDVTPSKANRFIREPEYSQIIQRKEALLKELDQIEEKQRKFRTEATKPYTINYAQLTDESKQAPEEERTPNHYYPSMNYDSNTDSSDELDYDKKRGDLLDRLDDLEFLKQSDENSTHNDRPPVKQFLDYDDEDDEVRRVNDRNELSHLYDSPPRSPKKKFVSHDKLRLADEMLQHALMELTNTAIHFNDYDIEHDASENRKRIQDILKKGHVSIFTPIPPSITKLDSTISTDSASSPRSLESTGTSKTEGLVTEWHLKILKAQEEAKKSAAAKRKQEAEIENIVNRLHHPVPTPRTHRVAYTPDSHLGPGLSPGTQKLYEKNDRRGDFLERQAGYEEARQQKLKKKQEQQEEKEKDFVVLKPTINSHSKGLNRNIDNLLKWVS
jgi:hypothetical protein